MDHVKTGVVTARKDAMQFSLEGQLRTGSLYGLESLPMMDDEWRMMVLIWRSIWEPMRGVSGVRLVSIWVPFGFHGGSDSASSLRHLRNINLTPMFRSWSLSWTPVGPMLAPRLSSVGAVRPLRGFLAVLGTILVRS